MRLNASKRRGLDKRIASALLKRNTWRIAALVLRVVDLLARIVDRLF